MRYLGEVERVWPRVGSRREVLERLGERVRRGGRGGLSVVEDEFDGGVPVRSARSVVLDRVDEELMWKLFDAGNDGDVELPREQVEDVGLEHDVSMLHLPFPDVDLAADWSLLGMPWLAYFPPDTGLAGYQ